MMTIVTHVRLAKEPAWDDAFRKRAAAASKQPGWVAVQLFIPRRRRERAHRYRHMGHARRLGALAYVGGLSNYSCADGRLGGRRAPGMVA
jgi:hypothetical protein